MQYPACVTHFLLLLMLLLLLLRLPQVLRSTLSYFKQCVIFRMVDRLKAYTVFVYSLKAVVRAAKLSSLCLVRSSLPVLVILKCSTRLGHSSYKTVSKTSILGLR